MHRSLHFQLIAIVVSTVTVVLAITAGRRQPPHRARHRAGPARARRAVLRAVDSLWTTSPPPSCARSSSPWCAATVRSRRSTSSACATRRPTSTSPRATPDAIGRRIAQRRAGRAARPARRAVARAAGTGRRERLADQHAAQPQRLGAGRGAGRRAVRRCGPPHAAHPLDRRRPARHLDRAHLGAVDDLPRAPRGATGGCPGRRHAAGRARRPRGARRCRAPAASSAFSPSASTPWSRACRC